MQRGRGVGAAAAQAAAERQALLERDVGAERACPSPPCSSRAARTREIVARRRCPPRHSIRAIDPVVAHAKRDGVAVVDEAEYRLQQVVAVGAPADDAQHQIELGGRRERRRRRRSLRGVGCPPAVDHEADLLGAALRDPAGAADRRARRADSWRTRCASRPAREPSSVRRSSRSAPAGGAAGNGLARAPTTSGAQAAAPSRAPGG